MKKLKNVIILFLVLINSFFQDVLFLPSNSKQVKVLYGIDNEFTNCNKTCTLTLKEVAIVEKINYKGKEYFEDKKHVLLVKVEVIFLEYAFTQCGLGIRYFDENHRKDYLINYREENSIQNIGSVLDTQGDFLLNISESLSYPFHFSSQKQNFQGMIYLCFNLKDEIFNFVLEQQNTNIGQKGDFDIRLFFNEQNTNDVFSIAEIGCFYNQVFFQTEYKMQ